jgi:hypothetical protein
VKGDPVRRFRWFIVLASLLTLLAVTAACGDDDDDEGGGDTDEVAEVEDTLRRVAEAGPEDIDFYLAHTTDNAHAFFETTAEECEADPEACLGDPGTVESIEGTEVSGDTATSTVTLDFGAFDTEMIREDDVWKLDGISPAAVAIPEGVTAVAVSGVEYAFEFDEADITDGNIAFEFSNDGEEEHELIVVKVNDEFDLDAILAAGESEGEELPPGVEEEVGFTFAAPGGNANLVPEGELTAGDYAMVCFIPTPDGEPHAAEGMHSEFSIE